MAKSKKPRNLKRTLIKIIGGIVILVALFLVLGLGLFIYFAANAPAFNESRLRDQLPTKIYDKNGELATVLYLGQKREKIAFKDIPDSLKDAVLATEDNRFYEHGALDYQRLAGAVFKNITGGFGSQGASTLTQQVVKRSFLTDKKSIERKAQEAYLSYRLEQEYSKDDIFEMYVNKIYYSDGIYGVQTAARYYFNKSLDELSLAETAYLAGLPQVPNSYNIYDHPEAAENRKDTVLYLMNRHNRITKEQMEEAQETDLTANLVRRTTAQRQNVEYNDPVYASYINVVKQEIVNNPEFKGKSINDVLTGGLNIYTNMDQKVQQSLQNNIDNMAIYKNKYNQAAATILDTKTGGLVGISGGRNYRDVVDRNLATDAHAIGSTGKPILSYGPAIEKLQWPTNQLIQDEQEYEIDGTKFKNYDGTGHGMVTMRDALRKSFNIPTLKTFQKVQESEGASYPGDFAETIGLHYKDKSSIGPAEVLGGGNSEFSPYDMAAAYAAFGNNGEYNKAHAIQKIVTQDNETIQFEHKSRQAMEDYTAYMITDILKDTFKPYGTAYGYGLNGINMAAKTGTSTYADETYKEYELPDEAAKDVWIVGYSPEYTMSVWMGFTKMAKYGENSFLGHIEQAVPQILYNQVMSEISSYDGSDFIMPDSVSRYGQELRINGTNLKEVITKNTTEIHTQEAVRENPRAASPTIEQNTTEQPTTERETTERATTERPTTETPTTDAPTTEASTTELITVQPPTTQSPVTPDPTIQPPPQTTQTPTTEAPTTTKP